MSHCCKKNTGLLLILLLVSILAHFGCANLIDDVIDFFDSNKVIADFGNNFFWGLGTAPTHVEDELDDAWLEFAENDQVAAWKNAKDPEQRLKFWTQPEVELDLAADTGIGVFRLGVDWSRLVPNDPRQFHGHALAPGQGLGRVQNRTALNHYKEIIDMVKERNMDVMLTLFHHSLPKWASDMGGWTSEYMHLFFIDFISDVIDELGDRVKYWNTFNEPTIFVLLTYCNGMWPPGLDLSTSAKLQCLVVPKYGDFAISMSNIEKSHILAYDLIRQKNPTSLIGVAHNVGWHEAYHFWDTASVDLMNSLLSFPFIDHTVEYLDFVGLNYYGKEIHDGAGVVLKDGEEYSESGRTVYPQGLYDLLIDFHERYVEKYPDLKYVITENGISDRTDILRPSYLIEHLLAINKAMADGVNVLGYLHWTISDNWEWKDGYCPKFGMVKVIRENNLQRIKLPSYSLFSDIVRSNSITSKQRSEAWQLIQQAVGDGLSHPMCRGEDGETALDEPWMRPIQSNDWRFGSSPSKNNREKKVSRFFNNGIFY